MPKTQKNRVINQLEAVKGLITEAQNNIEDGKALIIAVDPINQSIISLQAAVRDLNNMTDDDGNVSTERM